MKEKSIKEYRKEWWNSLTDEEKRERMSRAAKARARAMTPEQLRLHSLKMVAARKNKNA